MKIWLGLVLIALALSPSGTPAAEPTLEDFAYGMKIDVPAGTAVAAISLPDLVYTGVHRTDLGDMRVFNALGEQVPHTLRHALRKQAKAPWLPLPFFPLPEKTDPQTGGYGVLVRTGPDGAVVRVEPPMASPSEKPLRTYLIDLSRIHGPIAELRLKWQPGTENLMAIVAVDAGDDLVNWKSVQLKSAISDIRFAGHRLLNNTISLSPSGERYLRLRQLDSGQAIPLTRIDGRRQPEGKHPVRKALEIEGRRVAESPGVFEYLTGGAFPVDRINLIFDQPNSMADAALESRRDPQSTWTRRCRGLFYRVDVDGILFTSGSKAVTVSRDRHWRLTVDASESTMGRSIPRLKIGYRPHDLFFVARGNGPFILAFGSTRVEPLNVNVAALFDDIERYREKDVQRWVMPQRDRIVLGGTQRLVPQPQPLPLRRVVLWSILLSGVLVVAGMAWRLARRMKPDSQ
jgi:hypothetical protein